MIDQQKGCLVGHKTVSGKVGLTRPHAQGCEESMTDEEFAAVLAFGYERRRTEFKGPGSRSSPQLFAKVVRATLGMANMQDGGLVVIGVEDKAGILNPVGLTQPDLATWRYDDVAAGITAYSDPFVSFDQEVREHQGKQFLILQVREFEDVPAVASPRQARFHLKPKCGNCWISPSREGFASLWDKHWLLV